MAQPPPQAPQPAAAAEPNPFTVPPLTSTYESPRHGQRGPAAPTTVTSSTAAATTSNVAPLPLFTSVRVDPYEPLKEGADAAAVQHGPSWREQLWSLLFPDADAVGVEGAAALYSRGRGEAQLEAWHYVRLPLSHVMLYLEHGQRMADQLHQCVWYLPFFVLVLVFVLIGPGAAPMHFSLDVNSVHQVNGAQSSEVPELQDAILLDAFRMDTEAATPKSSAAATLGPFVAGNSAQAAWVYSHYNATVNAWTPQPNASVNVDAQVNRVAESHHAPAYMRLAAVRTRKDLMRWLQLQFCPRMWDCKNRDYERPWRRTVSNAHYFVGAARLISRRYAPKSAEAASFVATLGNGSGTVKVPYLVRVRTPLLSSRLAAPPLIPELICDRSSPVNPSAVLFDYDAEAGGYTVALPFATSCAAVSAVFDAMETPKRAVPWPEAYNTSVELQELWMRYTETDSTGRTNASEASKSCASFIFDPSVAEVLVQYVIYGTRTEQYTVVEARFVMASAGAVVRPMLRTFSLQGLSWDSSFSLLAVSIMLAIALLLYGYHLVRRMLAQYEAKVRKIPRVRRTRLRQLWCALTVLVHTQNLVHIVALALAAAMVASWWRTAAVLASVPSPTYIGRLSYPVQLDHVVRTHGPLLQRLCSAAVFFTFLGVLRFACLTPGMWLAFHTVVSVVPRLCVVVAVYTTGAIGFSMASVLLYGSALSEFRTFGTAFVTLIYVFLDGGRNLLNGNVVLQQTGQYSTYPFDDSLPSVRGSSIARLESTPLDFRVSTMSMPTNVAMPFLLLAFTYLLFVVGVVWITVMVIEAYRSLRLTPEAAALPLWRVSWARLAEYLSHALQPEYIREVVRRALLARREGYMLADIEHHLRLGCARAAATPPPESAPSRSGMRHGSRPTEDADVSLTMLLWLLPRELQLEYGAAHLRHWWCACVASVWTAQQAEAPWVAAQWRQHWERQPDSLPGWVHASVPRDSTIDERAARVGARLDELPDSIVKYVEGRFM